MYKVILPLAFIQCLFCNNAIGPGKSLDDISSIFSSAPGGCSNSIVYKHDSPYSNFIIVRTNDDSLKIDTIARAFDLADNASNIAVSIDRYSCKDGKRYQGCFEYCNDVVCGELRDSVDRFTAISGSVRIRRSPAMEATYYTPYKMYLELNNVVFEDTCKARLYIRHLDFDSVTVGWLPG